MHRPLHDTDYLAILDQISFLHKLREVPIKDDFPSLPFFDFASIMKRFQQLRKTKQDKQKWEIFIANHKKSQNIKGSENTLTSSPESKKINSTLSGNKLSSTSKFIQNRFNGYLGNGDSIFLDILQFKKGLGICDLYTILKKVQREKRKNKDNEKWNYFLKMKLHEDSAVREKEETIKSNNAIILPQQASKFNSIISKANDESNKTKLGEKDKSHGDEESVIDADQEKEIYLQSEFSGSECILKSLQGAQNITIHPHIEETKSKKLEENAHDVKIKENIQISHEELKFLETRKKAITKLLIILKLINKSSKIQPSVDEIEQLKRQANQFEVRFKRSYLYKSEHQLQEIRSSINSSKHLLNLPKKLEIIWNGIIRTMQVIEKHLQNPICGLVQDILCSFFNNVYNLDLLVASYYHLTDIKVEETITHIINILKNKHFVKNQPVRDNEFKSPRWMEVSSKLAHNKFGKPFKNSLHNNKNDYNIEISSLEMNEQVNVPLEDVDSDSIPSNSNQEITTDINGNESVNVSKNAMVQDFTLKTIGTVSVSDFETNTNADSREALDPQAYTNNVTESTSNNNNKVQESLAIIIAKRIQEIPGVDNELKKIEDTRRKIMPVLLNIKIIISRSNNVSMVDEDLERIKQRMLEFTARFNRIYSYKTKCQLQELKKMDPNPIQIKKKSKVVLVLHKLINAHQQVLQSLQVIEKQLQTIPVIQYGQNLFCVYYQCIYELTFLLKPFYGYLKTQILDDVEKLVIETTKMLKELPNVDQMGKNVIEESKCKKKQKSGPKSIIPKKKGKEKLCLKGYSYNYMPIKKRSKQSVLTNMDLKPNKENNENKAFQFMMAIKQRPGADVRRANWKLNGFEEPKTMIEILEENELDTKKPVENVEANICEPLKSVDSEVKIKAYEKSQIINENTPTNVKLIIVKRTESKEKGSSEKVEHTTTNTTSSLETLQWETLCRCKNEFKKYKKNNPLYSKKSLPTLKNLTTHFLDKTLSEAIKNIVQKINLDELAVMNKIIEDEIKY